jgi:hypothetical protein
MGYSETELASLPEGADLGLGCGNPQALAATRDRVLDELALDLPHQQSRVFAARHRFPDAPRGMARKRRAPIVDRVRIRLTAGEGN